MKRHPVRFLAGSATFGLLAAALTIPTVQVASANGADTFCADGTVPMATAADVAGFTEGTLGTPVTGTAVTGLSVVQGTEPEPFTGEYIGTLENGLAKNVDLYLFELSSDTINGANGNPAAGIWAGMSGSPVYTADGKLIGAVSYAFNDGTFPVAGVTPAHAMKNAGSKLPAAGAAAIPMTKSNLQAGKNASAALRGQKLREVGVVKVLGNANSKKLKLANTAFARTPKKVRGAAGLKGQDFQAAGAVTNISDPLKAGGNIAVSYTTGDLFIGGVGTVTATCGNSVWAFGHPMDYFGTANYAMSNASSTMVIPGLDESYKQVGSIGQPVGTITEDRLTAIRGELGPVTGVKLQVRTKDVNGNVLETYKSTVTEPSALFGAVSYLVGNSVVETMDSIYSGTAKMTWKIDYTRVKGPNGTLKKTAHFADSFWFPELIADAPVDDLIKIFYTDLERGVNVTKVSVDVTIMSEYANEYEPQRVQVKLKQGWVSIKNKKLNPKKKYQVRPIYKHFKDGRYVKNVKGKPYTLSVSSKAKGKASIIVESAGYLLDNEEICWEEDGLLWCDDFDGSDTDSATNFDEFIQLLGIGSDTRKVTAMTYYTTVGKKKKIERAKTKSLTAPGIVHGGTSFIPFKWK